MEQDSKPPHKPVLVLPAPPTAADTKVTKRKRLTKDNLVDYTEKILVRNATTVLPEAFNSLARRLLADDPKAFDQAAQVYGYVKTSPGVAINLLQQNNNYSGPNEGMYFEKVVRMMEEQERPSRDEPNIINVEAVDAERE